MKYVVYNCGYHSQITLLGKVTGKKYVFVKKMVTAVDRRDYQKLLEMTSKDIAWCPINDSKIPPFMPLEDWCAGKEGRFDAKPFRIYNPKKYKDLMKARIQTYE